MGREEKRKIKVDIHHKVFLVPHPRDCLKSAQTKIDSDQAHVDHFATLFIATIARELTLPP